MIQADRRKFMGMASGAGLVLAAGAAWGARPAAAEGLSPMTGGVVPISTAERQARIARAQSLMRASGMQAFLIESGSSLVYFTGVTWSRSERPTVAVIPADGEPLIVTPHFEEPSVRETLDVKAQVRVWQEDENALDVVAGWLNEQKLAAGTVGVEETVRLFIVDALAKALPGARVVNGAAINRGVRMVKTAHELALMQTASDITVAAYRWTYPRIQKGMSRGDVADLMTRATTALGGEVEFNLILLGEASAYPHGSGKPQVVREGGVVLMDCGCVVEGYQSDISRTFVFGEATRRQRQVWDQVHKGQEIAFAAARPGAEAGSVDDAVRAYYESLGYGPRYRLPGLSHRTGHGIGLDGHEPVNLVHGEATRLAPGMCFSDEPGIYIPGEFGVRLEDCFHMTETGPKWFSTPPPSLDRPFG
ncbi:MAG TPA: Xaa-Pro peptidase family protein [Phenylobacterium sp.]|nr:Xaa-Pro peptidase family protein [Phenylobacterium sp.]